MEDDTSETLPRSTRLRRRGLFLAWAGAGLSAASLAAYANVPGSEALAGSARWNDTFTPGVWMGTIVLLALSAFFSASEVAFYSLHQVRLRSMRQNGNMLERLAARLMKHPGNLLTSILMGNCVVNVLFGVVLGVRVETLFQEVLLPPNVANPLVSYALAVALCTAVLVFFGEITPKLLVVRNGEQFVRFAAVPVFLLDRLMTPIRAAIILFIAFLFRVTRFSEVLPAPFMTDEEFKTILSEGEATGVIEEEERQMIQGILEFSDVMLREILVPRPDMIALPDTATVGLALAAVREHEFARIPVYKDDLDSITGVLYAKDLLSSVDRGAFEQPILPLLRKAHFVPETMTVAEFMKTAQRLRTHLAIVVDEYGGTEGLVTLQDALREVVGDIAEEDDLQQPLYDVLGNDTFRVDGGLPLDELEEITGIAVEDDEHATVAGFVMAHSDRILLVGDEIVAKGLRCRVEEVQGKRLSRLCIQVMPGARSRAKDRGMIP